MSPRGLSHGLLVRLGEAHAQLHGCHGTELLSMLASRARELTGAEHALVSRYAHDCSYTVLTRVRTLSAATTGVLRTHAEQAAVIGTVQITDDDRPGAGPGPRSLLTVPVATDEDGLLLLQLLGTRADLFDDTAAEVARQLCWSARIRMTHLRTSDDAVLATLLASLDDPVIISHGPLQHLSQANSAAARLINTRQSEMVGSRVTPTRWTWRATDGTVLTETPTEVAYRTGTAIREQHVHVAPAGLDPNSTQGRVASRHLIINAVPVPGPDGGPPRAVVTTARDVTVMHQLEREHRDDAQRLSSIQLVTGLAWWTYEPATGTTVWSEELYRLAGLNPNGDRIDRDTFLNLTHPDDRWAFADPHAADAGSRGAMSYRLIRPDGDIRHLKGWYQRFTDPQGLDRIVGVSIDDTDREHALQAMAERRYQFERAFDGTPYGTMMVSMSPASRGQVTRVNRALLELLSLSAPVTGGQVSDVLVGADDAGRGPVAGTLTVDDLVELARSGDRAVHCLTRSDGSCAWAWVTAVSVEDVEADDPFLLVHVLDITTQRMHQQELERLARTDTLTGLGNRTAVTERLEELCAQEASFIVLMLDLDRFKSVNDSHGHHIGDELIIQVADRLVGLCPPDTLVARLGGDEFVLITDADPIPGRTAGEAMETVNRLAGSIVEALHEPFQLPSGHRVLTGASIGIAQARPGAGRASLLRDADLAMYQAKELGGSRFVHCDEELRASAARRSEVEQRLRRALEQGHLVVHRQPIVSLPDARVTGFEALVRMNDGDTLTMPDEFVPVAEQAGLIADIDHWVLDRVLGLMQVEAGFHSGVVPPVTAVNISGQTLQRDDFLPRLRRSLDRHGAAPSTLCLEVTESSLLDDRGRAQATITALRASGVSMAIDDFGTGYSALGYLQTLSPDVLKIDRTFISGLTDPTSTSRSTISAILSMARAQGVEVIAEGVETREQAHALVELGCRFAQGWLFGAAQPWAHYDGSVLADPGAERSRT